MRLRVLLLLTAFLSFCMVSDTSLAYGDTLRVGRISNNPKKHYSRVKGFADYIVQHLRHLGYTKSEVVFARDFEQLATFLKQGKVDILSETAYSAAYLSKKHEAKILLREWRDGVKSYKSVLFSRKDASIKDITDLEGKVIAFEDPGSTSGYFLPTAEIKKAGLKLVQTKFPDQKLILGPGQVGYVFSGQEINIALWVQEGIVDAGAVSDLEMADTDHFPEAVLPTFDVFHSSSPYPRALLLVRGSLDKNVQQAVKQLLLKAHKDPEGTIIMDKYKHVSKYDILPEAERQAIDAIRIE